MNTIHIKSMKFKILFFLVWSLAILPLQAQDKNALDDYIQEAFDNNLVLQQKNISLERALSSLDEAKSLFLPQIDLNVDYLTGYGGRFIDIPVGDMLNPVYTSLNFLMQTDQFPQLENIEQNFFPKNQLDIKVRTSMPIYNSDIIHNKTIQGIQYHLKSIEIETYKRELVAQIKNSYFQYLMALENIKIYENAQTLVQKNVK